MQCRAFNTHQKRKALSRSIHKRYKVTAKKLWCKCTNLILRAGRHLVLLDGDEESGFEEAFADSVERNMVRMDLLA